MPYVSTAGIACPRCGATFDAEYVVDVGQCWTTVARCFSCLRDLGADVVVQIFGGEIRAYNQTDCAELARKEIPCSP